MTIEIKLKKIIKKNINGNEFIIIGLAEFLGLSDESLIMSHCK